MRRKIFQPLGLINPEHLQADEKFLFEITYEMFPDEKVGVYTKLKHLVIHSVSWNPFADDWSSDQYEYPLSALPWIVECIENRFLKPREQGGLSDFDRSLSKEFEGELIGINAMAHCCAENLPGFNVWNANRQSYIVDIPPHEWDIPRYMLLEQGLLAKLKLLANDYEQGHL